MKDRVPLYPGRVTLTPVSGQANTYDMVRADQPTEEGTPLNKETLLSNTTAEALGLSGDPTVNDAFGALDYVAQYAWYHEWLESQVNYGDNNTIDLWFQQNYAGSITTSYPTVYYADEISVDIEGNITLVNPLSIQANTTNFPVSKDGDTHIFAGKYITMSGEYALSGVRYVADDSLLERGYFYNVQQQLIVDSMQITNTRLCTATIVGPYNEILYSIDPDAYPSGQVGFSTYCPTGLVKDAIGKLGIATRIVTGSYIGTGTSGSSARNSLTFDSQPKAVMVTLTDNYNYGGFLWQYGITSGRSYQASTSSSSVTISWSGNTVSWYSKGGNDVQLNTKNDVYYYFAIL